MVDLTEFTSHHDFQVTITKIQNFVFGNKWLYVSTYWSHQNYENYENSFFFPIYHFSTFVFRKMIKIKISPLKSLTYFYILVPFTNSSNWSCTHYLYTTWEFQSKVNMKRNTKFRHGKLKSFHRYMKQKKTLYLAKISLMCDFFFF